MSKSKNEPPKYGHIIYIPDHEPESLNQDCKVCPIPIASIVDVEETQIREAYNQQVIDDLKLLFKEDDQDKESKDYSVYLDPKNHKEIEECYPLCLPPIIVARCPDDKEKFWILDGHHRYQAAVESGRTWISAQIINPKYFKIKNIDDLRFLQARENTDAVANRTNETKRRQVRAARLKSDWNANQIARYCHVSWNLVVDVIQEDSSGKYERKGAPADKVQEAIDKPENASKSNRELAKELNVSEGTVRKVRKNQKKEKYAPDNTSESGSNPRAYNWQDPHCLLDGKPLIQGDATLYNDYDGTILSFCDEDCAKKWAHKNNRTWSEYSSNLGLQEAEEYLNQKNWTKQQRKDFAEGIRAYHEHKNENSMPKTKNWADEKLDGYLYEEERQRQLEKNASDARALDNVSKKAQEFLDERAPAEPAKQQYQKPEVLDAPPASADSKPAPTVQTSKVVKSGSIPLKDVDNIQQIVDDVCDWLGDRVAAFAVLFQDKRRRTEDE